MSKTVSLYSPMRIDPSDFLKLIHEFGGNINDEAELDGYISGHGSHAFFYGVRRGLAGDFEAFGEEVEAKLRQVVCASIHLHLSHVAGSQPLALRFALEFARRWSGVASCAAYTVMTPTDIDRLRATGISPAATLSLEVDLVLTALPPIDEIIEEFGGFSIDAADADMMASARRALRELEHEDLDPNCETISGIVSSEDNADIWIVRCTESMCCGESDCGIYRAILQHLGQPPTCRIRLVHEHSESGAANRIVLAIIDRILGLQPGVLVGMFHLVLDAQELAQALQAGNRFRLQ